MASAASAVGSAAGSAVGVGSPAGVSAACSSGPAVGPWSRFESSSVIGPSIDRPPAPRGRGQTGRRADDSDRAFERHEPKVSPANA